VVVLTVIATCLVIELGSGRDAAYAQVSQGSSGRVVAVSGQLTRDVYGMFLIDAKNNTMAVYRYLPGNNKLQLVAARNFTYDLQLDDYNTLVSPREVKKIVDQQKRLTDVDPNR
jgi:hypothetical protein